MKDGARIIAEWLQASDSHSLPLDHAASLAKFIDAAISEARLEGWREEINRLMGVAETAYKPH